MNAVWHGAAPAAEGLGAADESRIGAVILGLDLAASYARSAGESAWRGEIDALERDLRRLRRQVVAVIANFKMLEAFSAKADTETPHVL
jgi:hypothetical protein